MILVSALVFGGGAALGFDGTRSTGDIAPVVSVDLFPRAATSNMAPGMAAGVSPVGLGVPQSAMRALTPVEAFRTGAQALRAGDVKNGLSSLEYAAASGHPIAKWKLGRMYADGEGVKQDDLRAFELFRDVADAHADESPGTPRARFVANAFVALGLYHLDGIQNSAVKSDPDRAREMFTYAASYFGDPDAQYHLGRMYLEGQGGVKDTKQAVRWLQLSANKGQYQAQAVLGAMLFKGEAVPRQGARGLMWLTLARDAATSQENWINDLQSTAFDQASQEERAGALAQIERWVRGRRD